MKTLIATMTLVGVMLVGTPASATAPTRAPRACLRALDRAEVVMDYAVQGFNLTSEMFAAVSEFDPATLSGLTDELNALAPQVRIARDAYDRSASACRAA